VIQDGKPEPGFHLQMAGLAQFDRPGWRDQRGSSGIEPVQVAGRATSSVLALREHSSGASTEPLLKGNQPKHSVGCK